MCFRTLWKEGNVEDGTGWGLAEIGLSREGAIANMVMRAMRHVEFRGEIFLEQILTGVANPEEPYLINDEASGIYLWYCIVREDREPPALPNTIQDIDAFVKRPQSKSS